MIGLNSLINLRNFAISGPSEAVRLRALVLASFVLLLAACLAAPPIANANEIAELQRHSNWQNGSILSHSPKTVTIPILILSLIAGRDQGADRRTFAVRPTDFSSACKTTSLGVETSVCKRRGAQGIRVSTETSS